MDAAQDSDPLETEIVAVLAAARERDRAPASLRARIEHERGAARPQVRRRTFAAGMAGALAAIAVALAVILPAGTPATTTIAQAARLSMRGPSQPAPPITRRGLETRLDASVGELYFPDWHSTIGWRAVGARSDTLAGHRTVTVYYARGTRVVAYTIVATPPLPEPAARRLRAGPRTVRVLQTGNRTIVTWREGGKTCVLSGVGVNTATLVKLAAWSDKPGTV